MALRQRAAPPIPYDDLVRLQEQLSPDHASTLWEGDDKQVFVARVPGETPDFVNDLEKIVEAAEPADIRKADACILLTSRQVHQVPLDPLKSLMADRVAFDDQQCAMLRTQLPGTLAHTFFRAPEDPRRRLRLGVRFPCARVADVDDDVLEELVEQLGPRLEKGMQDLHCVYLLGAEDHVRLEPDLFLQDLLARWQDEARRARVEAERASREQAERKRRERDRLKLVSTLEARYGHHIAYAPVRHGPRDDVARSTLRVREDRDHAGAATRSPSTTGPRDPGISRDPGHAWIRDHVDSLPTPRSVAMTDAETVHDEAGDASGPPRRPSRGAPAETVPRGSDAPDHAGREEGAIPAPVPRRITTGDAQLDQVAERLGDAGYDVLVRPDVPGHHIDLAAERAEGYPQRVIVGRYERLRAEDATAWLGTAKHVDADLALAVADAIDPEAQRIIVATKVRRIRPSDIANLSL